MGKKFKPSQFPSYADLFPHIEEAETLGQGTSIRKSKKQFGMAAKAAVALGGNAPAWIIDNLS